MAIMLLLIVEIICISSNYIASASPLYTDNNLCAAPCAARCSPQCLPNCCAGTSAPAPCGGQKQEFMVASVEEGDTEECGDKGFNSPTDNSEDPPGTITIPLPPTMYTPPKPGEEAKELPLPDFKLPASLLEGKMPGKSMTLTPEPAGSLVPAGQACNTATTPSCTGIAPVVAARLPPAPPPPAPVAFSGNTLQFPRLPPVTISEIPGRANRLPLPPPKLPIRPAAPVATMLNFPRPPPIHVTMGAPAGIAAAGPSVGTVGMATPSSCVAAPCDSRPRIDPIAKEMEQELNSRYGKKH